MSFAPAHGTQATSTAMMLIPNKLGERSETSLVRGCLVCSCTWVTGSDGREQKERWLL